MATLKVTSTLDPSGFNKGVDGMKRKAKEINGSGGTIFGNMKQGMGFGQMSASVAAGNLIRDALVGIKDIAMAGGKELSRLGMVAKNLGTEVPAINEIQDALAEWGVEGERVITMLEKIDIARAQAVEGNALLAKSFEQAGVSMEDLTKLDPTQIFSKMTKSAATGGLAEGATGQAMTGISAIIGKRNMAGLEMPMMEYGKGFRKEHMFEPDQRAADIMTIRDRKARAAKTAALNAEANTEAKMSGIVVSEEEIKQEQDRRAKEREMREKMRQASVKQARERVEADLETKRQTIREEGAARLEEEKNGVGFQRMEVSQEQSVGIGSIEGGGFDMGVANEAKRQTEIAEKTKEIMAEVKAAIQKVEEHSKKMADAITAE